jgi:hypothetical protein
MLLAASNAVANLFNDMCVLSYRLHPTGLYDAPNCPDREGLRR